MWLVTGALSVFIAGCGAAGPFARWTDGDNDGVVDLDDLCPDVPEDREPVEDADGCPDPDNDGDGILDVDDTCPLDPEDMDGFDDDDGCPDPNNDGDHWLDGEDHCPDEAETFNGWMDEDGCPDVIPDSDGDGLLDPQDQCPDFPEDIDLFKDDDGCPDIDNDNDGILDTADRCPNEAESINGYEDEDGCPEWPPRRCNMRASIFHVPYRIYFPTGHATISELAGSKLRSVARGMVNRRRARVLIVGHSDDRGSAAGLHRIGLLRAEAVRDALISLDVHPMQLAVTSVGADQARTTSVTKYSRAADRRVDFVVVRTDCPQDDDLHPDEWHRFDADGDGQIDEIDPAER